ncbi:MULTISPECIES: hypothetical protein [Halomonadaceae]|jgi:hypothetical protein|uniref:hypothetical protein n=1 Tax=Halomonadaceae TaxID=28256 RepID=UPI000C32C6A0|nr:MULTISPECIES: hypothetical protein [unclassified Halomonas]PKG51934.1 hypothetical protein CXF87_09685 [Halomonas sp. MES3-P3E]
MSVHDNPRSARVGTLSRNELTILLNVLAPYRSEKITAPIMELATRLARIEDTQGGEAAQ